MRKKSFGDWIADKPRGEMSRLARVTGLAYSTIWSAANGYPLRNYRVATVLSEATGGVVSAVSLCDPEKKMAKAG